MDDTQPNEVRLARKGSAIIPRVRCTRPAHPFHDSRPFKRPRQWQPTINAPGVHAVVVHLPRDCRKGAPGSHNARKRWIEDQKHHLQNNRHLVVVSFKYLDHDNTVLFNCRTQSTSHHATDSGSHRADPYLDSQNVTFTRQGLFRASFAQSDEPGPSRIRPAPHTVSGHGPRRPDNLSWITPPVQMKQIEPWTTGIWPNPVHIVHGTPVSRQQAAAHTAPPTDVIDLTLDRSSVEEHSARWSTFRSGHVDIVLPLLSDTFSSLETSANQRSSTNHPLETLARQSEEMPVDRSSDHCAPNICLTDTASAHPTRDDQLPGPISDQLQQHDILESARSSPARLVKLEDEAPSLPYHDQFTQGFTSACANLTLSLGSRDRPRRLLHDHEFTYVVTAHGIIDQVATRVLKFDRNIQAPSSPFEEFVDDACILSHQSFPIIVLGHAREQDQISFLSLRHGQVSQHVKLCRGWNTAKRPGVSAMTSLLSPLKFATGGYDHRVHLWDIAHDLSSASAVELTIKHASVVHCLLPVADTSHKLVSVGADRDVPIYDMSSERVVQVLKTSCTPHHAHKINVQSCTLLEVSHLETQFEIRDHRKPNQAVQRFGFLAEERRGRFEKADSWSNFVVCGDRNGAVHLWDLRNVSTEVALRQCFKDPVVQVAFSGPRLLACSKRNELAGINVRWGE